MIACQQDCVEVETILSGVFPQVDLEVPEPSMNGFHTRNELVSQEQENKSCKDRTVTATNRQGMPVVYKPRKAEVEDMLFNMDTQSWKRHL